MSGTDVMRCWKCGFKMLRYTLDKTLGICPKDKKTVLVTGILTGIDPSLIEPKEKYEDAVKRLAVGGP